jgi:hypothetical protein
MINQLPGHAASQNSTLQAISVSPKANINLSQDFVRPLSFSELVSKSNLMQPKQTNP